MIIPRQRRHPSGKDDDDDHQTPRPQGHTRSLCIVIAVHEAIVTDPEVDCGQKDTPGRPIWDRGIEVEAAAGRDGAGRAALPLAGEPALEFEQTGKELWESAHPHQLRLQETAAVSAAPMF